MLTSVFRYGRPGHTRGSPTPPAWLAVGMGTDMPVG